MKFYEKLSQWFKDTHTSLKLQSMILFEFQLALRDPMGPQYQLDSESPGLFKFIQSQHKIGWSNVFCGLNSTSLSEYMGDRFDDSAIYDGYE